MLDKIKRLTEDGKDAVALKVDGRQIVGYFCSFTPVEVIEAAGLLPLRITGDPAESVSKADEHLEAIMCPYVRSCFDLALQGKYDYLSGLVIPHSCDSIERLYNIWRYKLKPAYSHLITVPHVTFESSYEFFENEIANFRKTLEDYIGRTISDEDLSKAIANRNEQRRLLRELYTLRKQDPPQISGVEALSLSLASVRMPAEVFTQNLREIIEDISDRSDVTPGGKPRIMLVGSEIDDLALVNIIEESGADVVMDDTCLGSRNFWQDVSTDEPPLRSLARHYLGDIKCARTYRGGSASERFAYLADYASEFSCRGAILDVMQYCDTYELEVPGIRDCLEERGVKVLVLDDSYSARFKGQMKTRVETFIELLGQGED
jgi:bzd-type benzoyl-CoA reductase N subunit